MLTSIKQKLHYILRWSEKYTKTDMVYLASGSLWLSLNKILGVIIAVALSIIYARYLTKDIYGNYRYILSFLGIFGFFSLSGVGTAIVRSVARGFDKTYKVGAKIIFFSTFGITLVGIISSLYFFFIQKNPAIAWGVLVGSILIPLVEGTGNFRGYLDGKKAFREKTIINLKAKVFSFLVIISAIALIYKMYLSPLSGTIVLVVAYLLSNAIPNIYYQLKTLKKISPQALVEPQSIRYGLHLTLAKIPQTIAYYLDSILIFYFLGPVNLAVYSFAIAPVEQIKSFINSFSLVAFPKFAVTKVEAIKKTLPSKLSKFLVGITLIIITYIIFAPLFFKTLFPRYLDSILFSQIAIFSLLALPLGFLNYAMEATKRQKAVYLTNTLFPWIQIILIIALIPSYGILGAVVGKVIGRLFNTVATFIVFKSKL